MKTEKPVCLRLGSFELDISTGELRPLGSAETGRKVLLQEQPFRVLRILIERNGAIATREEIKRQLWPNDTIVDFDHSINVAIGTLRRAFGDSATRPKYIETIARRGYRLMIPAEPLEAVSDLPRSEPEEDTPDDEARSPLPDRMLIGMKVSHYRVIKLIGGGGMGLVYEAEDLKLGRRVALKFLPQELIEDSVSLLRFEREAQTASSLNHPNICTVFEIEEYEGQPFIVMELLEGETLRDRLISLEARPVPLGELMDIAAQTCDGLQTAHANGIIHRDVKPANLFLIKGGVVKILDFGLAKIIEAEESAEKKSSGAATKSLSHPEKGQSIGKDPLLTRTGLHMGTASYMSPEQVRKEKLDARTDLFSFGVVLYEMATGRRAFLGDDTNSVHDAVLNQKPIPVLELNPDIPVALVAVITKALEKDRDTRWQSAAELRAELEQVGSSRPSWLSRNVRWIAAVLLVIAAGTSGWFYWRTNRGEKLYANDTIVLSDIANQTSDPVLSDALNLALGVEFSQSPYFQVLGEAKVRGIMQQLNHPMTAKVTPEIAREVCLKTNSKALITSSIVDTGNHYRLEMQAINCTTGKSFARVENKVALRNQIVHALGDASAQLRRKMGEPRSSVTEFNKPLEIATSSSPDALQLLSQGFHAHFLPNPEISLSYYQRAIDLDPLLGLAWASIGAKFDQQGKAAQALEAEKRAYELRDRLTGQLKFLAVTLYLDAGLGDLDSAYPIHEEWIRTFPLDPIGHFNFATLLMRLGQYDRAADEIEEGLRLSPTQAEYEGFMRNLQLAGRLSESKAVLDEAQSHNVDSVNLHDLRHRLAFLQHDETSMQEQIIWAKGHKDALSAFLGIEADVKAYHGRFGEAGRLQRASISVSTSSDLPNLSANSAYLALEEAESGSFDSARQFIAGWTDSNQPQVRRLNAAFVIARAGDTERAKKMADEIRAEAPFNTLIQNYSLPAIYAIIKLRENDAAGAVETLRPAIRYDLASPPGMNDLYPAYLRGLAYLKLNNGPLAAAEFQKLLDHPTIIGRGALASLSYLQIGRAQAMMRDRAAARRSYKTFLELWKDADPDVPSYKEAKAEYSAL